MADEGNILTDLGMNANEGNGADNQPAIGLISQYVKDLSVENPNAPKSYQWSDAPQLDAPAVLPSTPRPDLAQLRRTAAKAPVYDPLRPRPPPRPTPVQLRSVQLN